MNAPVEEALFVRPRWGLDLESSLSYATKAVLSAFRMTPGPRLYLEIPGQVPSSNRMYKKSYHGGARGNVVLDRSVLVYRQTVAASAWRKPFVPRGTVGMVVVFESPDWITKKHRVRARDVDNPVKPLVDALKLALDMKDELVWEAYQAKLLGRQERTHVWLFDLGEVIPALGAQPLCLSPASTL